MKKDWLWQRVPRIVTTALMTVMLLASALVVHAAEEKLDDKWHFVITPYIWIPSIDGSMELDPAPGFGSGNLEYGAGSYLEYLDFVGMLDLQMQKGRWSLLADSMYVAFSGNQTANFPGILPGSSGWNVGADWALQAFLFEFAGAFSVFQNEYLNLDLLAGVRYARIDGKAELGIVGPLPAWARSQTFSETENFVDPIVGFKGKFELGKKWYLPYYFDIGGFSVDSDLTLQALATIGYRFSGWFSMTLGYRYLYYDFGDGNLVEDLNLHGPTLGLSFTF